MISIILGTFISLSSSGGSKKTIVVASKNFNEQLILGNIITEDDMKTLNYRADNGEDPKVIAEDFLKSKELIK